ncbi:MAG TPA: hypothetical protein VH853_17040 [Polyangia bacterium]|nr:hypothetical protein [Polyangia bacterium]
MVVDARPAPTRNWPSIWLTAGLVVLALGLVFAQLLTTRGGAIDDSSTAALVSDAGGALASGHPGRAILDYERARLLAPRSEVVRDGLARARAEVNLPSREPRMAGTTAQLLRTDQWGWVALVGLGLGAAGLIASVWSFLARWGLAILLVLGGALACLGFWGVVKVSPSPNLAVVVAQDAVARVAPSAAAETSFMPPEGSLVTIERTQGDYSLVTAAGRQGWVRRTGVETILPFDEDRS